MVVRLDVEPSQPDGEEPGPGRVRVELAVDVGGVDDACESYQRGIACELVVVDEDLERAATIAVVVFRAGRVERVRVLFLRYREHLIRGNVENLGVGVDEAADEPGAGDAVGLRSSASDPFHERFSYSARGLGSERVRPGRFR